MFEVTLESLGLTVQKYRVLAYLDQAPATPSELACRLTVEAPTVTRLVAARTERGYVSSEVDGSDRRRNVLRVTQPVVAPLNRQAPPARLRWNGSTLLCPPSNASPSIAARSYSVERCWTIGV